MSTNLDAKLCDSGWSEEYDCVPLRLRSKMLRIKLSKQDHVEAAAGVPVADDKPMHNDIFVDRKENRDHNDKVIQIAKHSVAAVSAVSSGFHNNCGSDFGPHLSSLDKISSNSVDYLGESDHERSSRVSAMCAATLLASKVVGEKKANSVVDVLVHQASEVSDCVSRDHSVCSASLLLLAEKFKHGKIYEFDDNLDNVVLGERRRMLISRKLIQSSGSYIANKVEEMTNSSKAAKPSVDTEKQESDSIQYSRIDLNLLSSAYDPLGSKCKSFGIQERSTTNANPLTSSVLSSLAIVKKEPVDISELCNESKSGMQNVSSSSEMMCVKSEPSYFYSVEDGLDHLPLSDRIKMILKGAPMCSMDMLDNLGSSKESVHVGTNFLESVQPISISRPLKRRRTATNSVETALEEDAPELLKVLIERGILVDEMKLYGEEDSDGELDDSLSEDGFGELEAVISQLFSQRESFLKFPLLRTKGVKVSYCLACLLSLVEQTRFLQNRKWPVEWGWCRDLQSFIFVFHRHNRIVLERPEYGYATYFFELLNSVPATWQIKRLVTALKLTSCGRITLMENKPLVVGEDLSEGEARVLADYGWTPNTGLGTMLNFCDRVFHDRKQEMDSSEWRSKIGKQLLNGYNGGNIVSQNLPNRLNEDPCLQEDEYVQVKLEQ